MKNRQDCDGGFDTVAIRGGQHRTNEAEHNDPIFTTSSFVFDSASQAAARFAETEPGNVYSRFTNPTVRAFEERLAALESGGYAVATASGMGAILTLCLATLKAGDEIVASRSLFGSTISLFNNILSRFGVVVHYVDLTDCDQWSRVINSKTRMLFLETPSNPLGEIADIRSLAELAHSRDCLLVVDNVTCTPVLQRPLELGADVVVHSATKYIDGQGRCVGGALVTKHEQIGMEVYKVLRTAGPTMSPFNAWVFLKGLETLSLRMHAHCANAMDLALWLEQAPAVKQVYYPGLESHPQHQVALTQQQGYGGIVSFEVYGGRDEAWAVIDNTELVSITANLGDTKTTMTHPATTTHSRITAQERAQTGITEALLRVSVGLENLDDIKADLQRGFYAIGPLHRKTGSLHR
ncbi:MAG: O-succinylhomoserine sulfhydrylase [Gammaproteobacteria bacterium]|nr:O-succinylhomoserine sulfhydrylase [Gammaproteobacteria bacterium]